MSELDEYKNRAEIAEANAVALGASLDDLRQVYDEKFEALENEIGTLKNVIAGMQQTIGNTIAQMWGHGSTVPGE